MEKLEKLNYDTIILGGTLEALIHSYVDGIPLIMVNPQIPFYRDLDPTGLNKNLVWRRLSFFLSYAGLNPLSDKSGTYRFDEDNILTIFGKSPYKIEIKYNNIIRYDQIQPTEKIRVFDYIKVENLRKEHQEILKSINTGKDFVNHFLDNIENVMINVAAVSYLTQQQLNNEEYSEVYARLKATTILQESGIIGRIESLSNGANRTHKIKTTTLKREILFDTSQKENELLSQKKITKDKNLKKITDMLGNPYAL